MNKERIIQILNENENEIHDLGVESLFLFGSAARDEANEKSDVDLLVQFNRRIGLFHLFRVQHRLEEMLNVRHVDLVQYGAVHPALRERVYGEAIRVT